jgi:putative hemolysin
MSAGLLILLAFLLGLSAVISASETAFFTLRPWRVDRLRRERPGAGTLIAEALRDPRVFVVSIIVGTEMVNIASANVVAILERQLALVPAGRGVTLAAGVVLTSGVLILVCDLIPKSLAVAFPDATALRLARPLSLFFRLVRPVASPLARLTSFLTERRRSGGRAAPGAPAPLSEEDFRTLVDISRRDGVLTQSQTEMIEAAFRLGDIQVRQVMVPRPDVIALPETASVDEALAVVREHRHSRMPVHRGSLDEITGVLYAKDLLARRFDLAKGDSVKALARPAVFVPEVTRARQLIRELQSRHVHLAIVVDEYGGTAGVVTLEDLLEEMMGEFADEFEAPVRVFRPLKQRGTFWVRASMPLTEFNRRVRGRLKEPEVDTVGGYVLKLFGRVPAEGDTVSDNQFAFLVKHMKRRRILVLHVTRRKQDSEADDGRRDGPEGRQSPPPGPS